MTHALRHHHEPQPTVLRSSADYIIRDHVIIGERRRVRSLPLRSAALKILAAWRRRNLARRHLAALDARAPTDIGPGAAARDRELAKYFWQG